MFLQKDFSKTQCYYTFKASKIYLKMKSIDLSTYKSQMDRKSQKFVRIEHFWNWGVVPPFSFDLYTFYGENMRYWIHFSVFFAEIRWKIIGSIEALFYVDDSFYRSYGSFREQNFNNEYHVGVICPILARGCVVWRVHGEKWQHYIISLWKTKTASEELVIAWKEGAVSLSCIWSVAR